MDFGYGISERFVFDVGDAGLELFLYLQARYHQVEGIDEKFGDDGSCSAGCRVAESWEGGTDCVALDGIAFM